MTEKKYLYGLDLSLSCTGVSIFDLTTLSPVHVSSIETNKKASHGVNLKLIVDELTKLKQKYPPEVITIERGFSRFNTATQVIYRVHGVTNYTFYDISQVYYPPKKIKEAIVKGDASKPLVRSAIEKRYPNIQFKNEDESDSFAIALTYLILNNLMEWEKYIPVKKPRKKAEPKIKTETTTVKKVASKKKVAAKVKVPAKKTKIKTENEQK